jgi:hypothetical protein
VNGREIMCLGCRHAVGDKKSKDNGGRCEKVGKA